MQDFKTGILKLNGLADLVVQDDEKVLKDRIEIMNLSKSVLNTIVLDAENEDYQNLQVNLSGIDTMLKAIDGRMVSATGMPHTLILGDGANGMFSAGTQEAMQFADFIKRHQVKSIKSQIEQWNHIMTSSRQGPTSGKTLPGLGFDFKPIWQMDDKEKAELRSKNATSDQIYIQNAVLDPSEVRESRFGGDTYGMEISIDKDLDDDLAEMIPNEVPVEEEEKPENG
jgi:phage-related protein (TIGR01555 family)